MNTRHFASKCGGASALRFVSVLAAGVLSLAAFVTPSVAQTPAPKKILFISGPKDHGAPGRHEYILDLTILKESLEKSSNLKGFTTELVVGKAPHDMKAYEGVAAIVIESSSDRDEREVHPLFPPTAATNGRNYDNDPDEKAFVANLTALVRANKIGIVILHYANWVENWAARSLYYEWTGGLWVQPVSKNPVDDWSMTLEAEAKGHPILNGVKPWTYHDEVFQRFHLPNDKRRTNLVLATPSKDTGIGPQIASFAYQRADGGRGFVYGGMDWHDTLKNDDYRRFLLNGIAWAANIEVPATGVASPVPDVSGMTPGLPGFPGGRGSTGAPGAAPAAPAGAKAAAPTAK